MLAASSTEVECRVDAVVDAGLDQRRPGQPGQRVEHDEHEPDQQRAAELAQQAQQPELAAVRASAARSTVRHVAHRRQGLDARRAARASAGSAAMTALKPCRRRRQAAPSGLRRPRARGRRAVAARLPGRRRDAVAVIVGECLDAVAGRAQRLLLQPGEQLAVVRAAAHQLVVRALVGDAAVVQHDDAVGEVQRRDAVRDEQRRAVGQHLAQPVVDGLLGAGVDRAGRVVEDQDRAGRPGWPGRGRCAAAGRRTASGRARRRRCRSRPAAR